MFQQDVPKLGLVFQQDVPKLSLVVQKGLRKIWIPKKYLKNKNVLKFRLKKVTSIKNLNKKIEN